MLGYLSKEVKVIVDRPLGSIHPEHNDIYYTLNYGYIPNTVAGDGKEVDVYILGEFKPVEEFVGTVIAVVHRKNDIEDKLVVAKNPIKYSKDQIDALIEFQERFFDIEIITC